MTSTRVLLIVAAAERWVGALRAYEQRLTVPAIRELVAAERELVRAVEERGS